MISRRNSGARRAFASAALAVLVLGAAACSDDSDGADDATATDDASSSDTTAAPAADSGETAGPADDSLEPVRIGYASVDQGSVGLPGSTAGAKAAVEYINAELGGVNGHPVELVACSVDLDPQSNQSCGQQFANDADLTLVNAGFMFNGASFYTALESSDLPVVGSIPLNDADFASQAWFWSAGQLIQRANVRLAMIEDPDATSFGMLRQDNATGETSESSIRAALEEFAPGAELTPALVAQGSTDLVGAVSQLGDQDVVFLNLGGAACIQALEALDSIMPDTPVVAGAACANDSVVEQVGAGPLEGVLYASNSEIVTAGEVSEDAEVFKAKFPEYGDAAFAADPFAAHQWGILLTIRNVLADLGEDQLTDRAEVSEAVEGFTGPVVLGGAEQLSCPGPLEEQVCAETVRGYVVLDGESVPLEGNEFIEVA